MDGFVSYNLAIVSEVLRSTQKFVGDAYFKGSDISSKWRAPSRHQIHW